MEETLHLVQLRHRDEGRRVAVVQGERLRLLEGPQSVYACVQAALGTGGSLRDVTARHRSEQAIDYADVYAGRSDWRLLPAFDHPADPARCLVTGTGLTHRKSADNRHAMHQTNQQAASADTDSSRMYAWGVEGRPPAGTIGVQPEWFYKGDGGVLRAHNEPLSTPAYAEDGGEEPEIAVAYVVDASGQPWRVGFAIGNEFSDHHMEQRNYLYLAHSKLRECAIGPELLIAEGLEETQGTVRIEREGRTLWTQQIASGEANMVHSLENLEHHHFKYASHRRRGDVHIHFLGTAAFSFGAGIQLEQNDVMEIAYAGFGRPLRNPIQIEATPPHLAKVRSLA